MTVDQLEKGDIVTYRNGQVNRVNKPIKYKKYFDDDLTNKNNFNADIIKVQRFVKFLGLYRLKTIYKRD